MSASRPVPRRELIEDGLVAIEDFVGDGVEGEEKGDPVEECAVVCDDAGEEVGELRVELGCAEAAHGEALNDAGLWCGDGAERRIDVRDEFEHVGLGRLVAVCAVCPP